VERGPYCVSDNLFDLHDDVSLHVDVHFGLGLVQGLLKVLIAQLVRCFKFTIFITILLNRIVNQVNEFVVEVLKSELFGGSPDIAVTVEVCLHDAIMTSNKAEAPHIKLPLVVKHWVVNVLLYDHSFLSIISIL
jgi:hypothetical protein